MILRLDGEEQLLQCTEPQVCVEFLVAAHPPCVFDFVVRDMLAFC